jgi:hypothetical protein
LPLALAATAEQRHDREAGFSAEGRTAIVEKTKQLRPKYIRWFTVMLLLSAGTLEQIQADELWRCPVTLTSNDTISLFMQRSPTT